MLKVIFKNMQKEQWVRSKSSAGLTWFPKPSPWWLSFLNILAPCEVQRQGIELLEDEPDCQVLGYSEGVVSGDVGLRGWKHLEAQYDY